LPSIGGASIRGDDPDHFVIPAKQFVKEPYGFPVPVTPAEAGVHWAAAPPFQASPLLEKACIANGPGWISLALSRSRVTE
jgi:hypothetical protein